MVEPIKSRPRLNNNKSYTKDSKLTTEQAESVHRSPFPLTSNNEPIEQTFNVTSHRVEYVQSKSPLDTPVVQQLLAKSAAKSKTHALILELLRTTKNKALEHRLASILMIDEDETYAKKINLAGQEALAHQKTPYKEASPTAAPAA